jgi:hypothetical protein
MFPRTNSPGFFLLFFWTRQASLGVAGGISRNTILNQNTVKTNYAGKINRFYAKNFKVENYYKGLVT